MTPLTPTAPPRWGLQTGFFQRRQPAFWAFIGLLLLTGPVFLLLHVFYAATDPVGWALAWGLMLLYIVPVVLVVRWLDLYEREPRSLVIAAFLWGAVVSVVFSSFGNDAWGIVITRLAGAEFSSEWSAALTAPIVEEIYKVLGVVLIALIARAETDDLMDGFVYGAMVGLGFTVTENIDYFLGAFGGGVSGVLAGFWVRVVASGLYGHVLYTGLAGIGVAYFVRHRYDRTIARRWAVALGLLGLAIVAHFFWNSPLVWDLFPLFVATAIKGLPFFIVLVVVLRLARRREHLWLMAALARDRGRPGMLPAEAAALADPGTRRAAGRRVRRAAGRDAERLLKQLHRAQIDLAMVVTRVDFPDHTDLVVRRGRIQELRARLWAIPGVTEALRIPPAVVEEAARMPRETPWAPDRMTGPGGAAAWAVPDPAAPPVTRVPPGIPLQVLRQAGDWAEVRAHQGWTGWLDARLLAPLAARPGSRWR